MHDDQKAADQPASEDPAGQPGTGDSQWTRRNFIYGSAAAAAAMAFLRGRGAPHAGHPGGTRGAAARGGGIRPLVASPYVCGQVAQASGSGNVVSVPISQGTGATDAIVVCITTNGNNSLATTNPVTDDTTAHGMNTYTQVNTESGSSSVVGWIYACVGSNLKNQLVGGSSPSHVIVTFKASGTSAHTVTVIGVPGATAVDSAASVVAAGSSTTPTVAVTPSVPNETLIALEANGNGGGAVSWTAPFQPVPVYAGGTVTMVALSNESSLAPGNLMVAGGDVEGYFLTSDTSFPYGYQWSVINSGLYGQHWRECACIAWSQLEQSADGGGVIYSCCGDSGSTTGGGFLVSTDYGNSWSLRSSGVPALQFAGNNTASPLPTGGYPRSTGNLLAQDPANEFMYAATYSNGVYRCSSAGSGGWGSSWSAIGPSNQGGPQGSYYCRSLALHPNLTTLFVATSPYNSTKTNGLDNTVGYVWMTTNNIQTEPAGSVEWVQLTGLPNVVEELIIVGNYIYAACGYYGIYWASLTGLSATTQWNSLNDTTGAGGFLEAIAIGTTTEIPPQSNYPYSYWATLSGYSTGSGSGTVHTIVAFCDNPQQVTVGGSQGYRSIVQIAITNPGGSNQSIARTDLVAGATVNVTSYPLPTNPSSSQQWWYPSTGNEVLSRSAYTNAHITIDTTASPPVIYATGDKGFYYYSNGTWQIAINGLPLFSGRSVAVDPGNPNHIVFGDSDFCSWDLNWGIQPPALPVFKVGSPSQASLENNTYPPAGQQDGSLEGFALAIDPQTTTGNNPVYISTGEKYTNDWGDVIYHPAVATGTAPSWTNGTALCGTNYGAGNAKGNISLGLAVARDTANNLYVIAAVDSKKGPSSAGGVWLLSNGSWSNPATGLFGSENGTPYQPFAVPASALDPATPGNSCVYVFDRGTGLLYRSAVTTSLGTSLKTWTQIWTYSGGAITDSRTGYVALNPTHLDELWISTPTELVRIQGASKYPGAGSSLSTVSLPANNGNAVYPGAIAIAPGGTYGTVYCIGLGSAASPNTQLFSSTNDGTSWNSVGGPGVAANASYPGDMAVASDGRIYIASAGQVVTYGYPAAGVSQLGMSLHTGADQYADTAGQIVTSTAPVTITGSITSSAWLMLVAALET